MRIGFVGYGNMARSLAGRWRAHELAIGGRSPEKAAAPAAGVGGRRLVMPICGDGAAAGAMAPELARDVGVETLDVGGLRRAPHVEALAAPTIRQLFGGDRPSSVFNRIASEA